MAEKKYKTFKDYYQDPEFKKRHMEYINSYVTCSCGTQVRRAYMTVHKKTKKHIRGAENNKEKSNKLENIDESDKCVIVVSEKTLKNLLKNKSIKILKE